MSGDVRLVFPPSGEDLWCSRPPAVVGTGFAPLQEVELTVECRDGADRNWQSLSRFLVDGDGRFDSSVQAGMGDSYYGVDPEGPFWSLACLDSERVDFVPPDSGELQYRSSLVANGSLQWEGRFARRSRSAPIAVSKSAPSIAYFHNGGAMALCGSDCLRSLGFRVDEYLVPSYGIDLQPLLEAWFRQLETSETVVLIASGRASEAALEILVRRCERARGVIFSGSGLRFGPWRFGTEELTYVVCDHASLEPRGDVPVVTRSIYAEAVADRTQRDRGRIAVEKIEAPLDLFSGLDDQIWPSSAFSELVGQRRKSVPGLITEHRTFVNVGHDLGPELGLPGLPTSERAVRHPTTDCRLSLGGKASRQGRARRAVWQRLLELLMHPEAVGEYRS